MKPLFTDRPEAWTRASRCDVTPAEYASAVERYESRANAGTWFLVDLIASVLLIGLVMWVCATWGA